MPAARPYSGTLSRRYTVDVPADPGWARPDAHRVDEGHRVDTSGRDEAPRGGGWVPQEYTTVQPSLPGGSPPDFVRTHQRTGTHDTPDGGGQADSRGLFSLIFRRGYFPDKPNGTKTLDQAGSAGAAHQGRGDRGMDPSGQVGRRTVDGRYPQSYLLLGHTYIHPIERVKRYLHMNKPRIRRVLAPSIARETGSVSPGGYSSQYDPAASAWSAGPRQPDLRRLIRAYGQAQYQDVDQSPENAARHNPGPIGNGGW